MGSRLTNDSLTLLLYGGSDKSSNMKQYSDPTKYYDKTSSEDPTQQKIRGVVKEYVRIFNAEFEAFKTSHAEKMNKIDRVSNKFAEMDGSDTIERQLAEWPETLENAFRLQLTYDEYQYLRSLKGMFWFLQEFPVFRVTQSI